MLKMRKILSIILVIIFLNCSNDDVKENLPATEIEENNIELSINGTEISENILNPRAYLCDEKLTLFFESKKNKVRSELFSMVLSKEGKLKYASFVDKTGNVDQHYRTADFIPSSTLNIETFEFVENEVLKIKFSGTLLEEIYNYLQGFKTIEISGQIEIKEFGKSYCNSYNDFIKLSNDIYFDDISILSQGYSDDRIVEYTSNSLNGFNISFENFTKFIKDMPIGTYNFNPNSIEEKIEFRKYIGIPKSFANHIYLRNDWIVYETSGSFTIDEKVMVNNEMVIKGKLNFNAAHNGIIEHTFVNAAYELK